MVHTVHWFYIQCAEAIYRHCSCTVRQIPQLTAALCRAPRNEADMAGNAVTDTSLVDEARQALPFRLTGAQDKALAEILDDMAYPAPMARLLQVQCHDL